MAKPGAGLAPDSLPLAEDFLNVLHTAIAEERDIARLHVKAGEFPSLSLRNLGFTHMLFENCRFSGGEFDRCSFLQSTFRNCDFSNAVFQKGYFKDCTFLGSKFTGAKLPNGKWKSIAIQGCNFQYATLDQSSFEGVDIVDSNFNNADFTECTHKRFTITNSQLVEAGFFRTPLKGLDFSTNTVGNLLLSDSRYELVGLTVNTFQAAAFSRLLGLEIKDDAGWGE